ncbi:alpha/beta fold hydrolase [Prosthecomicrobium sp. N25]|uniref:alpha/beta fold hydrolase n=1 Tax=Prosthecomicrobium sp. N25 TaxID=3129254 RepID=UPI0030772B8B
MTLPDLFPGFDSITVEIDGQSIFARVGGRAGAPAIVLLHGYPQDHAMWHRIAPALSARFRVVVPDLRGYGRSSIPAVEADHAQMSKRRMAGDVLGLMRRLGSERFAVVGHDRGARVAYRLAFDHPGAVSGLALLDIVPTPVMWERMDATFSRKVYHWSFLAQPAPVPETMIAKAPIEHLFQTLASWTVEKDLSAFDPGALAHYRAAFRDPARIAAACEDYRAGATIDVEHDEADRAAGRKIVVPTLIVWGSAGLPADAKAKESGPLAVWRDWCVEVDGGPVEAGHFLAEENPEATLRLLLPYLERRAG